MAKSKTKYIGIGTGILTVLALLGWFVDSEHFDVEFSGDIFCLEECRSYFNITYNPTNPIYRYYYLQNKEGVKLDFVPGIDEYHICKPDKRCKSCGGCPSGWREIDFTSPYTSRYKYVYKFYRGKKEQFMILGNKGTLQTVKWSLDALNEDIDPAWIGVDELKDCKVIQTSEEVNDYQPCIKNQTSTFINNETGINETVIKFYDRKCLIGSHIEIINTTVCKTTGYQYQDKIWDCEKYGYVCYLNGSNIIAKAPYQSDQNVPECPVDGSERCYVIDLKTSDTTLRGYYPTSAIKKLEVEVE